MPNSPRSTTKTGRSQLEVSTETGCCAAPTFLCAKAKQASRRERWARRDILLLISRQVPRRSSRGNHRNWIAHRENGNGIKSRRQRPARRWKASSERGRHGASPAWPEGRSGQTGHRQDDAAAGKEHARISGPWAYVLARTRRDCRCDGMLGAIPTKRPSRGSRSGSLPRCGAAVSAEANLHRRMPPDAEYVEPASMAAGNERVGA
jgi:hypothetical protein